MSRKKKQPKVTIIKPANNSTLISDELKERKLRAFFNNPTVHNLIFSKRPEGKTVKQFENDIVNELITWDWTNPHVSYKMLESAIIKVTTSGSGKINHSGDEIKEQAIQNFGTESTWDSDKAYKLRQEQHRNSHNKSYKKPM